MHLSAKNDFTHIDSVTSCVLHFVTTIFIENSVMIGLWKIKKIQFNLPKVVLMDKWSMVLKSLIFSYSMFIVA